MQSNAASAVVQSLARIVRSRTTTLLYVRNENATHPPVRETPDLNRNGSTKKAKSEDLPQASMREKKLQLRIVDIRRHP